MKKYKKIIVWGAKSDTGHTHSFIHGAIIRAAQSMGIECYWLDNRDNVDESFFNDAIVITEQWLVFQNGYSNNLPLNNTACYIVHYLGNRGPVEGNPGASMYLGKVGKLIDFRFAADWGINGVPDKNYAYKFEKDNCIALNNGVSFYETGKEYDNFYSIWATDLLPDEINFTDRFTPVKEPHYAFFGGTIREDNKDVFFPFIKACEDNKVQFVHNCPWRNPLSIEQIRKFVSESYLAPDFRPPNHLSNGYISCRIIKNISYGKLGITNCENTYNYFENEVAYSNDTYELFDIAKSMRDDKDLILRQMMNVKCNHTYVNRLEDMITAAEI
jgi:hypothetical protein